MAIFVLVHGAWGGSYGFRTVRKPLLAAGHDVYSPSLTGLGERVHLSSPQVDLTTHVTDVVNAVTYEDLRDIVLLGYSYGGMVVTGALEYIADRVSHLVYLDAFVPSDGQALNDLTQAGYAAAAVGPGKGDQWLVELPFREYEDSAEAKWNTERRVKHPVRCFSEPVRLPKPLESYPFTRTYIKATADPRPDPAGPAGPDGPGSPFWRAADHAASSPAWRYRELDTNHMILSNRPAELVELLLELA
jgi:pimeloyl-ACP methyl ester carboxylesterase